MEVRNSYEHTALTLKFELLEKGKEYIAATDIVLRAGTQGKDRSSDRNIASITIKRGTKFRISEVTLTDMQIENDGFEITIAKGCYPEEPVSVYTTKEENKFLN